MALRKLLSGRLTFHVLGLMAGVHCLPVQAIQSEIIDSGFNGAVFLTAPADDSRLFVVERQGVIKVRSGGVWSTFLDISSQVASDGERGLLGLAFDPNYRSNGQFYVDYIDNVDHNTQIARYTVSANANIANTQGTTLLTIQQPSDQNNHKAGWIGFNPKNDNNLYIATGDGGGGNDSRPNSDPPNLRDNNAQRTDVLLGKILRIDVHPSDPKAAYSAPDGNPFKNGGGAKEVFDYGLRNPYRNSFDRATGNLIIGDVGQDAREEIDSHGNAEPGGKNFGWRLREGFIPTPSVGGDKPSDNVDPVIDFDRSQATTIIGGYVYRGSFLKEIFGEYFFADFGSGRVWSMDTDPTTGALLPNTLRDRTAELNPNRFAITSFGEDAQGNLYLMDLAGHLLMIVPEPGTYAMLMFGLASLGWRVLRRRA